MVLIVATKTDGPNDDFHDQLVIFEHDPPAPQTETTDIVALPLLLPYQVTCGSKKEEPSTTHLIKNTSR